MTKLEAYYDAVARAEAARYEAMAQAEATRNEAVDLAWATRNKAVASAKDAYYLAMAPADYDARA